jgi:hypothetical protein
MSNKISNVGYYIFNLKDKSCCAFNKNLKTLIKDYIKNIQVSDEDDYLLVHKNSKGEIKIAKILNRHNIQILTELNNGKCL